MAYKHAKHSKHGSSTSCPSSASSYSKRTYHVFWSLQRTHRCGSNNMVVSKQKVAGREMHLVKHKTTPEMRCWKCPRKACGKEVSLWDGTFFAKAIWKSEGLFDLFIFGQCEHRSAEWWRKRRYVMHAIVMANTQCCCFFFTCRYPPKQQ